MVGTKRLPNPNCSECLFGLLFQAGWAACWPSGAVDQDDLQVGHAYAKSHLNRHHQEDQVQGPEDLGKLCTYYHKVNAST